MSKLSKKEIEYFSEQLPEGVSLIDIRNECHTPSEYGVWDFVQQFYPNYYSCGDIMYNNDIDKVVNGEWVDSEASTDIRQEIIDDLAGIFYPHDFDEMEAYRVAVQEEAQNRLNESNANIYQRAIEGFIAHMKGG